MARTQAGWITFAAAGLVNSSAVARLDMAQLSLKSLDTEYTLELAV
jgi:hypothetical protein